MTKKEAYFTDYNEVEKLIKDKLNIEYEILPGEECNNYSCKEYSFTKAALTERETRDMYSMSAGKSMQFRLGLLMQVLVNEGHLEPGTYIIDCSW